MVGTRGFEPPTTCTPSMCATRLRYVPTQSKIGRVQKNGRVCNLLRNGIEEKRNEGFSFMILTALQQSQDFAQFSADLL
jgi:hypothetical protein